MENEKESACPCYTCKHTLYCKWACDELNTYAEGKTFAEIMEEFIASYDYAAKRKAQQRRRA